MNITNAIVCTLILYSVSMFAKPPTTCSEFFLTEHNTLQIVRDLEAQVFFDSENITVDRNQPTYDEFVFQSRYDRVLKRNIVGVTRIRYTHSPLTYSEPRAHFIADWEKSIDIRNVFNVVNETYDLIAKIITHDSRKFDVGENEVHNLAQNFMYLCMLPLKGLNIRNADRSYTFQGQTSTTDQSLIIYTLLNIEKVVDNLISKNKNLAVLQFFQTLNYEIDNMGLSQFEKKQSPPITAKNFHELIMHLITRILKERLSPPHTYIQESLKSMSSIQVTEHI